MKRQVRKLALRSDTLRVLRSDDMLVPRGALQCYTVSALVCPATYCASCVSCDCEGTD